MTEDIIAKFENKNLCIAVSGKSGCGNTTTSRLLADTLGIDMINYTFRSLAQEENVSLDEIISRAAVDDSVDRLIDRRQVELAGRQNCVLASRLAIWMKQDAILKVYLYADEEIRASRIHQREGGSIEDIVAHTRYRDSEDHRRYLQLYGIDNDDYEFADLKLDAGSMTPPQLVEKIIEALVPRLS